MHVILTALLCYSTVNKHTRTSQACRFSTVWVEPACVCFRTSPVGLWTHMGWLIIAGIWDPSILRSSWEEGWHRGGVGGVGGEQWLHSCTGHCRQHVCSRRKLPWVVASQWEQGALAERAAVWRRFFCLLHPPPAPPFVFCLLLIQLINLLLCLSTHGPRSCSLLCPSFSWRRWGLAFGEMRATAAPLRRPGPCALRVDWSDASRQHKLVLQRNRRHI